MKKSRLDILAYCLLAVSAIVFFLANHYTVFEMDDLWYATNLVTGEPLKGFSDIWQSQVWHYLNWGGRSVTHGLLQISLLLGETAADIINLLMLGVIVFLILRLSGIHSKNMPFLACLVLGFLVLFNANWYQTLFWQSGVANYLYITVFILLFLSPYMRLVDHNSVGKENTDASGKTAEIFLLVLLIPIGLMTGWSNENMGPAAFLGALAATIISYKKNGRIRIWMIPGLIACLVGCVACILAPGNFVRIEEAVGISEKGLLWRTFLRCYSTLNGLFYYLKIPVLVLIIVSFVYLVILDRKLKVVQILYLLMALASWGAFIISPHYPDRASFGTMVLLTIPITGMMQELFIVKEDKALFAKLLCAFVLIMGIYGPAVYICQRIGWIV